MPSLFTSTIFTEAELDAIAAATSRAEGSTSGEIVTYVVERSDDYPAPRWQAASFGAVLAASLAAVAHELIGAWGVAWIWIVLPALLGGLVGYGLGRLPALIRWLTDDELLERRTLLRAESAFLEEEVFHTEERTGILLFISLLEHRVIVLGDAGINAKVDPGEWVGLVDHIVAGIRAGRAAEAVREAVERCGDLLERRGVERRIDDVNELDDRPRVRES